MRAIFQVIWSAPTNAADMCVRLCARADPGENSKAPSILARKLCAAVAAPASFTRQPPIVEPCCACDEAKYEVIDFWDKPHVGCQILKQGKMFFFMFRSLLKACGLEIRIHESFHRNQPGHILVT